MAKYQYRAEKWRKISPTVLALQFDGTHECVAHLRAWAPLHETSNYEGHFWIETGEGLHFLRKGDYVVKDEHDNFSVYDPDTFTQSHERTGEKVLVDIKDLKRLEKAWDDFEYAAKRAVLKLEYNTRDQRMRPHYLPYKKTQDGPTTHHSAPFYLDDDFEVEHYRLNDDD